MKKVQNNLFEIVINVFIVTLDQFNASLLNTSIYLKVKKIVLTPKPSELFIYMPVVAMRQLCAFNFVATVGEGLFCSRMTMLLCTKNIKNDLLSLVWMKLTGLHKAKT